MQSQNRKERQRRKRKEDKTEDWKKETRLGSYEELYIKNIIRIKSKIRIIAITIRNDKKLQQKKQVEITMRNSIHKNNIECIKSGNKYRVSDEIQR